jgi:glycosyltransferase involved in cell wall biosynthesis
MGIFVKEQVASLRKLGVDVTVIRIDGFASRINYFKAVARLSEEIGKNKYDLIHAQYGLSGVVGYTQSRLPVVVTFHGGDVLGIISSNWLIKITSRLEVWLNKLLACRAGSLIVQSREMKKALGLSRVYTIPFGVDMDFFKPVERSEACDKLNLPVERRRVLFANNPAIPFKQFGLAQKAVESVRKTKPDLDLVATYKEPREHVPLYMNACDILILTSLFEGSPNVVKEAMACNLPVVSVDVGDVREVIGKAENCFVVSKDPSEIAERIIKILDSGERSNGREYIKPLSMEIIAKRTIDVYKAVLKNK